MDRDDAGMSDRSDQARQGDTGMIGGEFEDVGPSDRSLFADASPAPGRAAFAPEDAGSADRTVVAEDPGRLGAVQDPPATATGEEPERLDRPGPREPGVEEGVYDQEADQARRQRPSDGL